MTDEASGTDTSPVVEIVEDSNGSEVAQPEPSAITEPGKLMRIALMLREMQEEVRQSGADEAGREQLKTVHKRALTQMQSVLSGDLRDELTTLALSFGEETPSESEIRIAQAQLIGWLEGLFQGIQAAVYNQQLHARAQLDQLKSRGLPSGMPGQGQSDDSERPPRGGTGQYL